MHVPVLDSIHYPLASLIALCPLGSALLTTSILFVEIHRKPLSSCSLTSFLLSLSLLSCFFSLSSLSFFFLFPLYLLSPLFSLSLSFSFSRPFPSMKLTILDAEYLVVVQASMAHLIAVRTSWTPCVWLHGSRRCSQVWYVSGRCSCPWAWNTWYWSGSR